MIDAFSFLRVGHLRGHTTNTASRISARNEQAGLIPGLSTVHTSVSGGWL